MRRVGSAKARGAADTKRPRCSLQATENCWGVNPSGPSPSGNGRTIGAAASTAARNDSSEQPMGSVRSGVQPTHPSS